MNKKIIVSVLTLLIIAGSTSFTAFASMDNGSTVIGNKAFALDYANNPENLSEIINAIILGGDVYVKNFNGDWADNATGNIVSPSVIPAVVYKSDEGEINFDAADTSVPVVASLKSIELGDDIVDNSIITNAKEPVYRVLSVLDTKGNEIIPDISKWTISAKSGISDLANFARIVYYKHDDQGGIIDATLVDAEGIAVKFDPSAVALNTLAVDSTLIVTVGDKAIGEANVIKDTLNVTVRAESEVKFIILADRDVSIILGTMVKKEVVVLDQYGKVITNPEMLGLVYGVKTTAVISYNTVDKKMYITYKGEATGTDTVVVQARADHKIKATANISIYDNTDTITVDN